MNLAPSSRRQTLRGSPARHVLPCVGYGFLLALLFPGGAARARVAPTVEPQALRLQITDSYLGVRFEADHEETTYTNTTQKATYDRLFEAPLIGLKVAGSIYHPNFLSFSLNGEFSPGYTTETSTYAVSTKRREFRELGNFFFNCILLGEKPYRTSLFLSQNYTYRDYDFFNRVEVNTWNYGANLGYQAGPVPFTIKVWQRKENSYGQTTNTSLNETGLTFDARNTRESGETSLNYTLTNHTRWESYSQANGTENSIGIADRENFGANDQIRLNTSASYSTRRYTDTPNDEINALLNATVEHSPTLSSLYDFSANGLTSNYSATSSDSTGYHGGISLRHQLFESLTSTLRIQGQDSSSNGSYLDSNGKYLDTGSETQRFGIGLTESYTKRLGSIGRFTATESLLMEHTTLSANGSSIIITDESHTFSSRTDGTGTDSLFLNRPYVDESSIVITDSHNSLPAYQRGIDYTISHNGSLTMIRRTALSTIPENSTVLVDYRAQSSASGDYNTLTAITNLRIDLWNGLLSCYYRYNSAKNSTSNLNMILQDIDLQSVGIESTWRWLRVGAEYETNASTYASYSDVRFFQSLTFKPDGLSTLSFDCLESKMHYISTARDEQNYAFTTRFQRMFSRSLNIHFEAGIAIRRGYEVNQTLETLRPTLEWNIGRLTTKAGYSLEYGKYDLSDERLKHTLFISAQRSF